jgi:TolB protein
MRRIAPLVAVSAAISVGTAGAAQQPVADGPGLVVAQGGSIYVEGRPVAKGAQPVWSPDGARIAYQRFGEIHVVDADGRNDRRLTRRSPGLHWPASSPAWSPDGRTIAFSGTRDVLTVPAGGGAIRNLTRSAESWRGNFTPAYSPDGRTIAFSRSTDAFNNDIFLMSSDGKNLRRLTRSQGTHDTLAEEHGPTWSPDGRTIVFVSNRGGSFDLYSIRRDGRGERRLTATRRIDEDAPRFGRDGRRLLYVHGGRVATVKPDGSGVRELGRGVAADWR